MNKTYKIIIAIALLFYSASCKNHISKEVKGVCLTAIQDTLKHNAIPIQIGLNNIGYSIYKETSKAPVSQVPGTSNKEQSKNLPSQISRSDRNKEQNPKNLENSADSYKKELPEKKEINKEQKSTETLEGQFQQSRLTMVPNGVKQTGYKQDTIADNENLKEWLDNFIPNEEGTQNEYIENNSELENNQFLYNSRNAAVICRNELSSSCLTPPATGAILMGNNNDSANLADKLILRTPEEKPSNEKGSRRSKFRPMGEALPTSLQDTNELIIKVNPEKAEIIDREIEKRKSEGADLDPIMEEIGLSNLVESNTVKDIIRLNIPYNPGEDIIYKIIFVYQLDIENTEEVEEKTMWYEPNYIIKNLTMETNSFSDNILDQIIINKWYEKEIKLPWSLSYSPVVGRMGSKITRWGTIVAVIDTGVNYTLPEFTRRSSIWVNKKEIPNNGIDDDDNGYIDDIKGWDFVDNDNDPMDSMDYGHGTNVAGIIQQVSYSISRVYTLIKIMPIRALLPEKGETFNLCSAIYYAVNNGANVINLSWGGEGESISLNDAIDYAYSKGVVIIAAAGNASGEIPLSPGRNHKVISVSAGNIYSNMTYFTNQGADILAPGKDIPLLFTTAESAYASGTSMAAPFVSAAAAVYLSINPKLHPMEVLYNLKHDAESNDGVLNGPDTNGPWKDIMCRIISAKPKENEVEITALAKYSGTDVVYSLDYAEGISPGCSDAWKNITRIYGNTIAEDKKIIWDTSSLPEGIYTIRLVGRRNISSGNGISLSAQGVIDRIVVKVDNQLHEDTVTFMASPFCEIDETHNAYIEIPNPYGDEVEVTPIFYDNKFQGNEICSPKTAVINDKGRYSIDLKRYIPDSFNSYKGPVGIEVKNYSSDMKISLFKNAELVNPYYGGEFIEPKNLQKEENNILGASWTPYIPGKSERENYSNNFIEWVNNLDIEYELKNNLQNMIQTIPRFPKEAKLVLYNPTNDDVTVNITFYADGKLFDTGYGYEGEDYYHLGYETWGDYCFNKVEGFGVSDLFKLNTNNDSRRITFVEEDNSWMDQQILYFLLTNYPFLLQEDCSLVTKLGEVNESGLRNVEWSSLTLTGSIVIRARSFISVPTWSFSGNYNRTPINYYCADACMVTNIYPKGSVFGAVVQENSDGVVEEVIPLQPS